MRWITWVARIWGCHQCNYSNKWVHNSSNLTCYKVKTALCITNSALLLSFLHLKLWPYKNICQHLRDHNNNINQKCKIWWEALKWECLFLASNYNNLFNTIINKWLHSNYQTWCHLNLRHPLLTSSSWWMQVVHKICKQ